MMMLVDSIQAIAGINVEERRSGEKVRSSEQFKGAGKYVVLTRYSIVNEETMDGTTRAQ